MFYSTKCDNNECNLDEYFTETTQNLIHNSYSNTFILSIVINLTNVLILEIYDS